MTIAIIGNDTAFTEAKTRLGEGHQYFHAARLNEAIIKASPEVIFDFNSEWDDETALLYREVSAPVFLNPVFSTLSEVTKTIQTKVAVFGFCGMPTFFNRPKIEIVSNESDSASLQSIAASLNLEYILVKDQVGMVTPRVLAMIINEAFETLQNGVASKEDIDLSMKLGTNYPMGPFEWSEKIGLENLQKLMQSLAKTDARFIPNF